MSDKLKRRFDRIAILLGLDPSKARYHYDWKPTIHASSSIWYRCAESAEKSLHIRSDGEYFRIEFDYSDRIWRFWFRPYDDKIVEKFVLILEKIDDGTISYSNSGETYSVPTAQGWVRKEVKDIIEKFINERR